MDMNIDKIMETVNQYIAAYAPQLITAIIILIIGKWLSKKLAKLFSKLLQKNNVDATLISFLENIVYYTLLVGVIIATLGQLGINTTSFLAIVGAAGLAVGLALKDSLSNFASGVMLILFRPFKVGDVVNAGGMLGVVDNISVFTTVLNTPDNQRVIIPNSIITGGLITNITANDTRRVDLVMGISYEDDIPKAKQIMEQILTDDEQVLTDPPFTLAVSELADSSVNFVVRPWVKTGDYWDVYFRLTERIKMAFDEEGITIPFPQRDVHMYTSPPNEN